MFITDRTNINIKKSCFYVQFHSPKSNQKVTDDLEGYPIRNVPWYSRNVLRYILNVPWYIRNIHWHNVKYHGTFKKSNMLHFYGTLMFHGTFQKYNGTFPWYMFMVLECTMIHFKSTMVYVKCTMVHLYVPCYFTVVKYYGTFSVSLCLESTVVYCTVLL